MSSGKLAQEEHLSLHNILQQIQVFWNVSNILNKNPECRRMKNLYTATFAPAKKKKKNPVVITTCTVTLLKSFQLSSHSPL